MDPQALLSVIPVFRNRSIAIEAIPGGLTNRNYRIETETGVFVLRIGGSDAHLLGIDRNQEVVCARAAATAGIGPEVVAFVPEHQAVVSRFTAGRVLVPEDARQPAMIPRLAETLRRCHACPAPADLGIFSPFATVRNYCARAKDHNVPLPADLDRALAILGRIEQELRTDEPLCLCHNDLLPTNCIATGDTIQLIDWEYAGLGDRFFDLGNLAVNFQLDAGGEVELLGHYFAAPERDHLRRLRMMRLVSDMRESLWGYLQAGISRLYPPDYYFDYGRKHLDRFLAASGRGVR